MKKKGAVRKAARKKAVAEMTPADIHSVMRLVSHTARMLTALSQSPSGQTAEFRGYDTIISDYKTRWLTLSRTQRKIGMEAAGTLPDLNPKTIKAAVAALED